MSEGENRSKVQLVLVALGFGLVTALIAAAAVTIFSAAASVLAAVLAGLAVGIVCFCLAIWRFYQGESVSDISKSIGELWNAFGRSRF